MDFFFVVKVLPLIFLFKFWSRFDGGALELDGCLCIVEKIHSPAEGVLFPECQNLKIDQLATDDLTRHEFADGGIDATGSRRSFAC